MYIPKPAWHLLETLAPPAALTDCAMHPPPHTHTQERPHAAGVPLQRDTQLARRVQQVVSSTELDFTEYALETAWVQIGLASANCGTQQKAALSMAPQPRRACLLLAHRPHTLTCTGCRRPRRPPGAPRRSQRSTCMWRRKRRRSRSSAGRARRALCSLSATSGWWVSACYGIYIILPL